MATKPPRANNSRKALLARQAAAIAEMDAVLANRTSGLGAWLPEPASNPDLFSGGPLARYRVLTKKEIAKGEAAARRYAKEQEAKRIAEGRPCDCAYDDTCGHCYICDHCGTRGYHDTEDDDAR